MATRIARVGRDQAWPLTQSGQEMIQQDIDAIYQVLISGIGSDYLEPDAIENLTDVGMGTIRVPSAGTMETEHNPTLGVMETERSPMTSSMGIQSDGVTG